MTYRSLTFLPSATIEVAIGNLDEIHFMDPLLREIPSPKGEIPSGCLVSLRGWLLLKDPPRLASAVSVVIDDVRRVRIPYGRPRNDIAQEFGNAALGACGFLAVVELSLVPGPHALRVAGLSADWREQGSLLEEIRFTTVASRRYFLGETESADCIKSQVERLATASGRYRLDGYTLYASHGDVVTVSGWAADTENNTGSGDVFAVIDEEHYVPGVTGLSKAQAAGALDIPAASGFTVRFPTVDLRKGEHTVALAIMAARSNQYKTIPLCRLLLE